MRIAKIAPVGLIAVFSLLLLGYCLRPGNLISDAHPARLAEIHSQFERCFAQQHWFAGWDQRFMGGYPAATYQYQFGFGCIFLLHALAGMSLSFAYKVAMLAGTLFAISMLFMLLRRRVNPWVALIAALGFLLSTMVLEQLAQGFWNHVLAVGFICLFVDRLDRAKSMDLPTVLSLMAIYALIAITHQYAAIATGLLMLSWLPSIWRRDGWRGLAGWAAIPVGAIALTLVYSWPILETRYWLRATGDFEAPPLAEHFENFLWATGLAAMHPERGVGGIAGLKYLLVDWPMIAATVLALSLPISWRRGGLNPAARRFATGWLLALIPFAVLFFNLMLLIPSERLQEMVGHIISRRFLHYIHLSLFVVGALALDAWVGLLRQRWRGCSRRFALVGMAVVGALMLTCLLDAWVLIRNQRLSTDRDCPQMTELHGVWALMRRRHDGRYRVLYQSTYGNFSLGEEGEGLLLHQSAIMALSTIETGMPQGGGMLSLVLPMFETTRTCDGFIMGARLGEVSPKVILARLRAWNYGLVVACEPLFDTFCAAQPRMQLLERFGDFSVYRFEDAPGNWAETSGGEPVSFHFDPDNDARMSASLINHTADNRLTVRVGYHPYWRATINGQVATPRPEAYGRMTLKLDETGPLRIEWVYSALRPTTLALNLVAWGAWLAAFGTIRIRARRDGRGNARDQTS